MARIIDSDPFYEAMPMADGMRRDPFSDGETTGTMRGERPLDSNGSGESEGEDQFIDRAIRRAARLVRHAKPLLNRVAPLAARAVAGAVPGGNILAGLLREDPEGGRGVTNDMFDLEDPFAYEASFEDEDEDEDEDEAFVDGETGYFGEGESEASILAETLLAEAGRAATDAEAAALAGGITITITGPAPLAVRRIAPVISRGTANIVRVLRARPATRPLVPVAGAIARSTTRVLTRRAAAGKPITPTLAAKVMARQTQRTLGKPSRVAKAVVRNTVQRRRLNANAIRRAER